MTTRDLTSEAEEALEKAMYRVLRREGYPGEILAIQQWTFGAERLVEELKAAGYTLKLFKIGEEI